MTPVATDAPKPNFLYVGTSKAGSTWLFNALALHPDVYLASNKGLYYFDQHFDRGQTWYLDQFAAVNGATAAGEISHSYLSSPEAAPRIADLNAAMRLLVCLREPVDRAFSDYLDLLKNGQFEGSFEAALEAYPRLVQRGLDTPPTWSTTSSSSRSLSCTSDCSTSCAPTPSSTPTGSLRFSAWRSCRCRRPHCAAGCRRVRRATRRSRRPRSRRHRRSRSWACDAYDPASNGRSYCGLRSTGPTRTTGPRSTRTIAAELRSEFAPEVARLDALARGSDQPAVGLRLHLIVS